MKNILKIAAWVVGLGIAAVLIKQFDLFQVFKDSIPVSFKEIYIWPLFEKINRNLLTPTLIIGVAFILLLEKLFPVDKKQKIFSIYLAQDFVWLLIDIFVSFAITVFYLGWIKTVYNEHLGHLTITWTRELPAWVQFTIVLLLGDFMMWFHHWVRHKVPWFWQLHTVHHSQRHMNMFVDLRYHSLEYFVSLTIQTIPFLFFKIAPPKIFLYMIFSKWYTRLYHANIKSNFGFLKHILVTPQSHRIHHSREPQHQDKNFGVKFTIWDRIFGTQYYGYDEYPETGIQDEKFPLEKSISGFNLILNPIRQNIYPLQNIGRNITKYFKRDT